MSRAERKNFEIAEMKEQLFERDGWECFKCGKQVTTETAQLAHLIPQRVNYIEKYGREVIYHPENMVTVCSLKCNNAVQVNAPELQEQLKDAIESDIEQEHINDYLP